MLVWSVKIADGLPDFLLYFQIILEIVDDGVVLFDLGLFVILVKFGVNIVRGMVVLMG